MNMTNSGIYILPNDDGAPQEQSHKDNDNTLNLTNTAQRSALKEKVLRTISRWPVDIHAHRYC